VCQVVCAVAVTVCRWCGRVLLPGCLPVVVGDGSAGGVIRGGRVPDAPMLLQRPVMVRTPVVLVPLWLMACWWCLKGTWWGRLMR
jgi:hypothetical protein